jgi:hypothetical protein
MVEIFYLNVELSCGVGDWARIHARHPQDKPQFPFPVVKIQKYADYPK